MKLRIIIVSCLSLKKKKKKLDETKTMDASKNDHLCLLVILLMQFACLNQ